MSMAVSHIMLFVKKNKLGVVCVFVFLTLLSTGFGASPYFAYNILPLALSKVHIVHGSGALDSIFSVQSFSIAVVDWFSPIYQVPILFFIASILLRVACVYVLYLSISIVTKQTIFSLITAICFCSFQHGAVTGMQLLNITNQPTFINASICGILLITSLWLMLKGEVLVATIFIALALKFHVLYGVTFCVFMVPGLYVYNGYFRRKYFSVGTSFVVLLFVAYSYAHSDAVASVYSCADYSKWFTYVFSNLEMVDDILMLFSLAVGGVWIFPVMCIAMYMLHKSGDRPQQVLYLYSVVVLLVSVGIEIIHLHGYSFGRLSEYFVAVQLRRSLWILNLFSFSIVLVGLLRLVLHNKAKESFCFITFIFCVTSFFPTPGVVGLAILLSFVHEKNKNILILFVPYALGMYLWYRMPYALEIGKSGMHMMAFVVCYGLFCIFWSALRNRMTIFQKSVLVPLFAISICLMLSVLYGVVHGNLAGSISVISDDSILSAPDADRIIRRMDVDTSPTGFDLEAANYVNSLNVESGVVLIPFSQLTHAAQVLYNANFLITTSDESMAYYSLAMFNHYLFKLDLLGADMCSRLSSGPVTYPELSSFVNTLYDDITLDRLRSLKADTGLRYFVSSRFYPEITAVFKSERHYVYDLSSIDRIAQ